MTKQRSIKNTFARHFVSILACSLLATFITWGILVLLLGYLFNHDNLFPANHYEAQIPVISEYAKTQGDSIMSTQGQAGLEKVIPSQGINYLVVSPAGEILYGDLQITESLNRQKLLARLNQTHSSLDQFVKYIPVMSRNGEFIGALLLGYHLKVTAANPALNPIVTFGFLTFFLSPFLYIILFTFIFGRRFSRMINAPLQQLLQGAEMIKAQNLRFSMTGTSPITEVNRLTNAFEDMRQELEHSIEREWRMEKERSTMFAALAHDLRTPLTIIQGHVEGMEQMEGEAYADKRAQYLQVIRRNTIRASKLLQDMNTIAELEKMSFRLQPLPVDIEEFADHKTVEYAALCKDKNITFDTEINDYRTVNNPVIFDPYRIIQVLDNLVSNSIRYTPEAGRIQWRIEITGQQVMMSITDNGAGFAQPQDLQQAFKQFYQGNHSSSRQKGHSGLGLYIAKLLIQHHGGQICAENNPACGATVRFTLPLQDTYPN
ncbi:HAMP domain-containing sensor histidine kinase [Paenibacillus sp. FSL W8-0186]|uniref:histidine kinase n=1 Tax=Paenibacillus woosongensis TaxID=307580 RepID=A0ABQ4MYN5_9BACL|nr:HAMP domain-containing sensor histidine kinase [Paenibacillus woosongensis]GIP61019.1 sensor histidine kinase [Paenibacillus woosongensis]